MLGWGTNHLLETASRDAQLKAQQASAALQKPVEEVQKAVVVFNDKIGAQTTEIAAIKLISTDVKTQVGDLTAAHTKTIEKLTKAEAKIAELKSQLETAKATIKAQESELNQLKAILVNVFTRLDKLELNDKSTSDTHSTVSSAPVPDIANMGDFFESKSN